MELIKTQDVYLPVDDGDLFKPMARAALVGSLKDNFGLEPHFNMIVLTMAEFENAIKDAKAEELKRIRDNDREIEENTRRSLGRRF